MLLLIACAALCHSYLWSALCICLGLIGASERSRLTFVIPLLALLWGHFDWVIGFACLIWLCDWLDRPLFSSKDQGVGLFNRSFKKELVSDHKHVDVSRWPWAVISRNVRPSVLRDHILRRNPPTYTEKRRSKKR